MKVVKIYSIYFLLINVTSCIAQSNSNECQEKFLTKDIPARLGDSNYLTAKNNILKLIKLPELEKGFNQLQIRIWYGYPYSSSDNLILLSKSRDKWAGEIWRLDYQIDSRGGSDSIFCFKRTVNPNCGWNSFIDSLNMYNILDLKDSRSLPGYEMDGEGQNIIVEYATCKHYRIYSYVNPWLVTTQFPEAKKLVNISGVIERQLSFKRLYSD